MININEINKRIDEVMKTDATFAREADFMLTHVPFKKLYDFVPESGQTNFVGGKAHYYINPDDYRDKISFTEQELLDKFSSQPNSHKFLLVQGNSGTGKSNLIRWIYYMYRKALMDEENDSEQIIFIQRSFNSLKEAVKRILDYHILPKDRTRYYLDKIGGGGQEAKGEELAETVFSNLRIAVKFDTDYDQYIGEDIYKGLNILLNDANIVKYIFMVNEGPIAKACQRIGDNRTAEGNGEVKEIFEENDFTFNPQNLMKILNSDGHKATPEVLRSSKTILGNSIHRHNIVKYLNSLNEKVIARSSTLDATDVQGIFREIRKELKQDNKNLTLFIEDINAYTGMDKALIEILIDDEEDDDSKKQMCRLKSMVGSTDNFYDLLHTSLKVRITDSVVVLDESVLSDNNKLVEFAARYINAVNLSKDAVDAWYYGNEEMPVADIKNKATSVLIDGKQFSIYPFTQEAIVNLYTCLENNFHTPRGLLKYVVKHNLTNWNTMESRIFETATSFTNVALRSFGALKLPRTVEQSIMGESEKAKQYIRLWGFNYDEQKIVHNSENEKILFEITTSIEDPDGDSPNPTPIPEPIQPKVDPKAKRRDEAINHINEWAQNLNPNFTLHKEMRNWIGKYILGHINWDFENILYSKAESVCKALSFIKIEGHEGQGNATLCLDRTSENADFFKALVYWNYDGDRKSWNFDGGLEEKIIAKVWLEKNKNIILDAIAQYGRIQQISPEYVVKAKLYNTLVDGGISAFNLESISESLVRHTYDASHFEHKDSTWQNVHSALQKNKDLVDDLFAEYFYRVVGSSDARKAPYYFVDIVDLHKVLTKVIGEIESIKDKSIVQFGDKNLEAPIESINIYHQKINLAYSKSDSLIRKANQVFPETFGENITNVVVTRTVNSMKEYLTYVVRGLNQATPPNLIDLLESADTPKLLAGVISEIRTYLTQTSKGSKLVCLSQINDNIISGIIEEILNFEKFMDDIDKKYAKNVNRNLEKEINAKKAEIESLVSECIKAGGGNYAN